MGSAVKTARLVLALGLLVLAGSTLPAWAREFPERPITAIIAFAPGGAPDILFRPLAELARKHLGVPVVITNKPGGGGIPGTAEVARAKPDGYTILMNFGGGEVLASPHLEKVPFDPVKDFEPVIMIGQYPTAFFVREDSPWKTLEDFIQAARKSPGELRYSHPGTLSLNNLTTLTFMKLAGINLTGIPTAGGGQAMNMLLGGHVEAAQIAFPVAWPQVQARQVRCLAYALPKRSEIYGQAPTFAEKGFDMRFTIAQGIAAPKGTPQAAIKKIHDAFAAALHDKSIAEVMTTIRFTPHYLNSEDFGKYVRDMHAYYGEVIHKVGLAAKK
ncbi:MAG: tripartite tricarboxylate transporter substrate binding protein [Candidatus Methylomirabilales bacterium]